MDITQLILALSTVLCTLVAGFLLAFTVVVMPGIQTLSDHDFLQSFKVIDRVIQNNQPVFMLVWLGSVLTILAATWIGVTQLAGMERLLVIIAATLYIFGAQLPTAVVNVPLNNQLQAQDLGTQTDTELQASREAFEPRWIRWNTIRTIVSIGTSVLLVLVLLRI